MTSPTTGWADSEDVHDVTGKDTTPESLALAQSMIELFAGTDTAASDAELISGANLRLLRKAVCFQAVWLDDHPDTLAVMDVSGVSQDGLSAQYANANAHLIAPLARACLTRLSWKKAPIRARARRAWATDTGNRDSAVRDDQYVWTPMKY